MSATVTGRECVAGCGRPTADFLCAACVGELISALRELVADRDGGPGLLAELDITLSKQDAMSASPGVLASTPDDMLPFRPLASLLADRAGVVVTTWARDVHEHNPHLRAPSGNVAAAASWLARWPGLLALHPAADEMHAEVTGLAGQIRAHIDRRPDLVYSGPCAAVHDGQPCTGHLYTQPRHSVAVCPECGSEHAVDERRAWMIEYALDLLVTGTVALGWARLLMDHEIPAGTWRSWVSRRRVLAHGTDAHGHPVYRFGDVCDLVAEHVRRKHAA